MLEKEPSRTAFAAAAHRAAHQVLEKGAIFADPLAVRILGQDAETVAQDAMANPPRLGMRLFIAARSHFAETALRQGIERRGVRQLVVLGAGLDTFAYRNPFGERLKVFEIDHPATQAWKRRRLGEAGIAIPGDLAFVSVDFERDRLMDRLVAAGLDSASRTFFMWLGVVPYLVEETVFSTLTAIGSLPGGAEVTFDYADPPATLSQMQLAAHLERAARVAALGEPWLSYFEPVVLHPRLRELGFCAIEDLGPRDLAARYRRGEGAAIPERGGHVVWAATDQG
ncbi:MAG: SAM-dependent methyltransferase [Caulobacteraceae bacterium]